MKGFIALIILAAWALCFIGGVAATIGNKEYLQAAGVVVTSAMAAPFVFKKIKEAMA